VDWELCDLASRKVQICPDSSRFVQIRPDLDSFGSVLCVFFCGMAGMCGIVSEVVNWGWGFMVCSVDSGSGVWRRSFYADVCSVGEVGECGEFD